MSATAVEFVQKLHQEPSFAQAIAQALQGQAAFEGLAKVAAQQGFHFDEDAFRLAERAHEQAQAHAFFARVQADEAFGAQLKAELAKAPPESSMRALVAFARAQGFVFTVDSYLEAASQHHGGHGPDGELSDADLEKVAGGYQPGPDGKTCIYDPMQTLTHLYGGPCPDGHVGPSFTQSSSWGCTILNLPTAAT